METYKQTNPTEATPIQKAKLAGIAQQNESVDSGDQRLRGSESEYARFVTVGTKYGQAADLIRIAKPGSPDSVTTGQQSAAESGAYPHPITRDVASAAIDLARKRQQ